MPDGGLSLLIKRDNTRNNRNVLGSNLIRNSGVRMTFTRVRLPTNVLDGIGDGRVATLKRNWNTLNISMFKFTVIRRATTRTRRVTPSISSQGRDPITRCVMNTTITTPNRRRDNGRLLIVMTLLPRNITRVIPTQQDGTRTRVLGNPVNVTTTIMVIRHCFPLKTMRHLIMGTNYLSINLRCARPRTNNLIDLTTLLK